MPVDRRVSVRRKVVLDPGVVGLCRGPKGVVAGHTVSTTHDHPFWNATDNEWQRADRLDNGDHVLTANGDLLAIEALNQDTATTDTAYNLTVDDIHTYYVEVGGESVLVHNICLDVDALSAAGQVADRNGFTSARRAAQKHGNRSGSFPLSTDQTARGYNEFGQDLLDDLLTAPNSAVQQYNHASFGQVTDVWGPNYGARFGPNNEFIGFLEF